MCTFAAMNIFRLIGIVVLVLQSTYLSAQSDSLGSMAVVDTAVVEEHANNFETIEEIVCHAKTFEGVRYRYGGSSPSGFDCSGFVK